MISKNVANTGEAKPILNSEYKKKKNQGHGLCKISGDFTTVYVTQVTSLRVSRFYTKKNFLFGLISEMLHQ